MRSIEPGRAVPAFGPAVGVGRQAGPHRILSSPLGWLTVLAGVTLAVGLGYWEYLGHWHNRWVSLYHDRNAHYQAGLSVACELRQGHMLRALLDLDAASLGWPVLHPLLLAAVLTVGGLEPRLAVLPSLAGWWLAAAGSFWLAGRCAPRGWKWLAGAAAAAMVLTSPAVRVMATDVMLESLGLGLTVAAGVAYVRWVEQPSPGRAAGLGLVLSALFLHKYNYWGLTVVGLFLTELLRRSGYYLTAARRMLAAIPWRQWLAGQRRRPLNYAILVLLALSGLIVWRGGLHVDWGSGHWGIRQPRLLVNAAYVLVLLRLGGWWWSEGRRWWRRTFSPSAVRLCEWGLIPPLVWLALPFRLQYFVWYAGPGNDPGVLRHSFVEKIQFYLQGWVTDYHIWAPLAGLTGVAAAAGTFVLLQRRWRQAGWHVLPVMAFTAAALTLVHPNEQMRFVHTWAPLLWPTAAAGATWLLDRLICQAVKLFRARQPGPAGYWLPAGLAAGLGCAAGVAMLQPPRVSELFGKGYSPASWSVRNVHQAYLPLLDGRSPTAVLCSLPEASWRWPFIEQFGHKTNLRNNLREIGAFDPVPAAAAARWLEVTPVETIVYIEVPPESPMWEPPPQGRDNRVLGEALRRQERFMLQEELAVPPLATVQVWRRR